jgi:ABC-type multidrug transport system fused ATPase/permease subunit
VVSHRHAVLERADVVLVMEGGRIVDRGSLQDLLERSPIMRSLWEGGDAP